MRFKLTQSALEHGLIATAISVILSVTGVWLGLGWSFMVAYMGAMFYLGREVCDLEKLYGWDVSKWNSAELVMPIVFNTVLALATWVVL